MRVKYNFQKNVIEFMCSRVGWYRIQAIEVRFGFTGTPITLNKMTLIMKFIVYFFSCCYFGKIVLP